MTNIPAFQSEADEAAWWYEHREELSQEFISAARAGKLKHRSTVLERIRARKMVQLEPSVLDTLNAIADRRGVPLSDLVNELLKKGLAFAEAAK